MFKKALLILLFFITIINLNCRDTTPPHWGPVELLWKKELPVQSSTAYASAGITIDGDFLYFADTYSRFYKIGTNGKGLMQTSLPNGSSFGVPVIWEDLVVVGSSNSGSNPGHARLYVFNKITLETAWVKGNFTWHAIPAIDEEYVYCTDLDKVYAFEKINGDEVWSQTIFGKNVYNPIIDGECLYFATGSIFQMDAYLYCLNKHTGAIVFQDTLPYMEDRGQFGGSAAGVAVWEDYIYVPADNRYVYCFNKNTGDLVWKFLADAPLETPARVSDDIVYTGSLNRTCYAINTKTGDLKWSYQEVGSIDHNPPQFYKNYVLFENACNPATSPTRSP